MTHRSTRRMTLATVMALTAISLAACGSGSSTSKASTPATKAGAPPAGAVDGVEYSRQAIRANLAPLAKFAAPGGGVAGLEKFKGGTITYIPITLQATYFQAQYEQISQAVAPLGIRVQSCDAKAQPTVATQCVNQAVAAKSIGIITDSLPFALAQNSLQAAAGAGIPLVMSDTIDPVPNSIASKVVTTDNGQDVGARLMANAIIADSDGAAHVLFVNNITTTTTKRVSDAVLNEFSTRCPKCVVPTVEWVPTAVDKIPTAVSVGLNNDPKIRYVFVQYDQPAGPPAIQGMKLSSQAANLKLVGYGSDISAMQRIATGQQLADVATDPALTAWNNTDRLLRMMTGTKVPDASAYPIFRRVFNASNVSSVDYTSVEAFKNGAWFSDGGFRSTYKNLWGVS